MLRGVVVDVGGVLSSESAWSRLDSWASRGGMSADAFRAALASVDPDGRAEIGELSEAEMRAGWAAALGLDEARTAALFEDVWDVYCGEPDRAMISFVRGLRPAYATGICSNSVDGARREEARRHGFDTLTDDLVYSHEVGLHKPDPAIYALVCERLRLRPDEVVFVDDRPENVEAATAAGLVGVLHTDAPTTIAAVERLLAGGTPILAERPHP